jgi:rifamycin polyketide synthase module 1/2/3
MIRTELIRPVYTLLAAHADARGERIAFRDDHRKVTYAELFRRTGNLAGHLRYQGLEHGDRAAIYMPNSVEVVESYLAITRTAGIGVCINPQATEDEVAYMLADSGARIILTDATRADMVTRLAHDLPALEHVIVVERTDMSAATADIIAYDHVAGTTAPVPPPDDLPLDAPAWILYTSGTTGRPKGVVLSQRSCLWVVAACWAPIVGYGPDDYALSPLPFFHSYALSIAFLTVVALGASEYIMTRFSTWEALRLLRTEPITVFPGVPTMFHYLLDMARQEGLQARALRVCISAGAIMPQRLNQAFEDAFEVPLLDGYGITETSTMVTQNWLTGTRIMGSCGLPLPGSAVRIVDPATEVDVPPGHDGEVWVRGPHLMLGYHNRPEETAQALRGGWYHTGDMARSDAHGYLTITGRIKELIIRGGENIAPAEVEEALVAHESVLDCAVVAAPHDALGEVPVAFVVPRDPDTFDADQVLGFCRARLAPFKVPVEVRTIEAIPRTGSGKILRYELQHSLSPAGEETH